VADRRRADPIQDGRRRLNERLRAEYLAGAEEEWRKRTGRPMTAEELERVLGRYPGTCRRSRPARCGYGVAAASNPSSFVTKVRLQPAHRDRHRARPSPSSSSAFTRRVRT
jgi:hypothetical protein